jgi:5-methyltetrahydropteroyltriglutamate--homocysteine methyltransferase
VTFAIHLCKGNSEGRYIAAGAYDAIAEEVFPRLASYDVLLLEYDDARSGGFAPLVHIGDDQVVVLGLVSSKRAALERDEEVIARVREASGVVALERLAVSCQCGFASTAGGNRISPETQRAKLQLVRRVADAVWG